MDQPWSGRKLHFVGIGGVGMSGLAVVAHALGARSPAPTARPVALRRPLRAAGIEPLDRPRRRQRPGGRRGRLLERDPAGQPRAHDRRPELHRADLLGELTRLKPTIAVSRHPRQDDDVEHDRPRAARRGRGPELPGRRRGPLHRRERRLGDGGVARGRGRRVRPLAAQARARRSPCVTNAELDHHTTYASPRDVDDTFRAFLALARAAGRLGRRSCARSRRRDRVRRPSRS